jgi:hypothetical protein
LVIPDLSAAILEAIRKLGLTDPQAAKEMERNEREKLRKEAVERRRREAAEQQKKREAAEQQKKREADEQKKRREAAVKPATPASTPPASSSSFSCPTGEVYLQCGGTDIRTEGCEGATTLQTTIDRYKKSHPDIPCKMNGVALPRSDLERVALPPTGLHLAAPSLLPPPMLPQPHIAAAPALLPPPVLPQPRDQIATAPPAMLHTPPQPPPEHAVPLPPKERKQARLPRPQRQQVNRGQGQAQAQAQQDAQDAAAAIAVIGIIGGIAAGAMSSGPTYSQPSGHHH